MQRVETATATASGSLPRPTGWAARPRSWRLDPRRFGRAGLAPAPTAGPAASPSQSGTRSLGAELRLFAITFLAGFLFVSILLA